MFCDSYVCNGSSWLPSVLNLIWGQKLCSEPDGTSATSSQKGILCALFLEFLGEPWHQIV